VTCVRTTAGCELCKFSPYCSAHTDFLRGAPVASHVIFQERSCLKQFGKVKSKNGVQSFIRDEHVLILHIQRDPSWHSQYAFGSPYSPLWWNIAVAAGWMGRAQVPFSVGETYRFSSIFIGDTSLANSCSASPIIFVWRLVRNLKFRQAQLSLECNDAS
jgi:hypothetical protein